MNNEILAHSALGAAYAGLCQVDPDLMVDAFLKESAYPADDLAKAIVAYLCLAPTAAAEDVYRFTSGKGLHFLPLEGFAYLHEGPRAFFELLTFAAKGLIAGYFPKKAPPSVPLIRLPGDQDLHERIESAIAPVAVSHVTITHAPAGEATVAPIGASFEAGGMSFEERVALMKRMGLDPGILVLEAAGAPLIDTVAPAPARVIGPEGFVKMTAKELERAEDAPAAAPGPSAASGRGETAKAAGKKGKRA